MSCKTTRTRWGNNSKYCPEWLAHLVVVHDRGHGQEPESHPKKHHRVDSRKRLLLLMCGCVWFSRKITVAEFGRCVNIWPRDRGEPVLLGTRSWSLQTICRYVNFRRLRWELIFIARGHLSRDLARAGQDARYTRKHGEGEGKCHEKSSGPKCTIPWGFQFLVSWVLERSRYCWGNLTDEPMALSLSFERSSR